MLFYRTNIESLRQEIEKLGEELKRKDRLLEEAQVRAKEVKQPAQQASRVDAAVGKQATTQLPPAVSQDMHIDSNNGLFPSNAPPLGPQTTTQPLPAISQGINSDDNPSPNDVTSLSDPLLAFNNLTEYEDIYMDENETYKQKDEEGRYGKAMQKGKSQMETGNEGLEDDDADMGDNEADKRKEERRRQKTIRKEKRRQKAMRKSESRQMEDGNERFEDEDIDMGDSKADKQRKERDRKEKYVEIEHIDDNFDHINTGGVESSNESSDDELANTKQALESNVINVSMDTDEEVEENEVSLTVDPI
jgi:hypothetical protein